MQEKFGIEWEHISSNKFLDIYKNWNKPFEKHVLNKELKENRVPDGYDTTKAEKNVSCIQRTDRGSGRKMYLR